MESTVIIGEIKNALEHVFEIGYGFATVENEIKKCDYSITQLVLSLADLQQGIDDENRDERIRKMAGINSSLRVIGETRAYLSMMEKIVKGGQQ
jgi:hypothetical protein